MLLSHGPTDHVHARLAILLEGEPVSIPVDVGISATGHFNPHTHDDDTPGILHIGEGGPAGLSNQIRLVTLDDFFDVWRERGGFPGNNPDSVFDRDHILDKTADASHLIRMFVNGQLNNEFERYTPHDNDDIVIRYDALPPSPTGLSLLPASDSGFLNSDRITNHTNLQIQVTGVTSGVTVEVRYGSTMLGLATAVSTTVIVTANVSGLDEGLRSLTAVQTVGGLTSLASAALTVTLDRTAPQFSLAPRAALPGQSWTHDIQSADEGAAGFSYTLIAAPSGLTLTASTGVLAWSPTADQIDQHPLTLRATDAAGNVREQTARLFAVDAAFPWQNPVESLDIDGNGSLVPLDALLLINRLNSPAPRTLPTPSGSEAPPPFYDPTKDNHCTPQDVLWVVNFLNERASEGEGEAEASFNTPTATVFAPSISLNRAPVSASPAGSGGSNAAVAASWPNARQPPAVPISPPQTLVRRASARPSESATDANSLDALLDLLATDQARTLRLADAA